MVFPTKRTRDMIKTSGLAKKKAKSVYKGHKKENYKKKKEKKIEECCICFHPLIKEVVNGTPVQTEKEKAVKELKDAKSLLDQGIITQDEYNQISNRLKPIILR